MDLVGAGLGFMAAVIGDGFVSPWQGTWTILLMGAGALALPATAVTVAWRLRLTVDEARDVRRVLRLVGVGLVWVATLSTPYVAVWVVGPELAPQTAFAMAAVGVLVWPGLAALVRVMIGWPPVPPLLWTLIWLCGGVVVSGTVLAIRASQAGWSDDQAGWYGGLVCSWLMLVPFAGYALSRARRRRNTAAPGSVESV